MGTMTFGSQVDKAEAQGMVAMCIASGVNFFDTANVYNQGASEEILGQVLGEQRKDVIVATKVRGKMQGPGEYEGLSKESIRVALEHSLRRLGTDYIDLYYLHQPDYNTPIEETLETMDALRREGKIRYTGASNFSAWQLCEMHWICEKNGWQPPLVAQPMYNLLARGIEQEYLSFTRRFEVANVCYNPLAGGLLSGKQSQEQGPLANTRFDGNAMYLNRYWHKQYFDAVEELRRIAKDAGLTLVQLADRLAHAGGRGRLHHSGRFPGGAVAGESGRDAGRSAGAYGRGSLRRGLESAAGAFACLQPLVTEPDAAWRPSA
jgi:1-deoxyxylulose-5-phosphate synthase